MSEFNMMVPLEIDLIDEGRFLEKLNKALIDLQEQIVDHVDTYDLKATKAKAKLTAEITLVCLDPDQKSYGCIAQIKKSLPAAPPFASLLMQGEGQTGEKALLCRKSGSTHDSPKQKVFSTLEGKDVDTKTGEIAVKEKADS